MTMSYDWGELKTQFIDFTAIALRSIASDAACPVMILKPLRRLGLSSRIRAMKPAIPSRIRQLPKEFTGTRHGISS